MVVAFPPPLSCLMSWSSLKPSFCVFLFTFFCYTKPKAEDRKGMEEGLVRVSKTIPSSFPFLSQGLIVSQGEALGEASPSCGCVTFLQSLPCQSLIASLLALLTRCSILPLLFMLVISFPMDCRVLPGQGLCLGFVIPQGQMAPGLL